MLLVIWAQSPAPEEVNTIRVFSIYYGGEHKDYYGKPHKGYHVSRMKGRLRLLQPRVSITHFWSLMSLCLQKSRTEVLSDS